MIDFDALVLAPGQGIFAIPVTINPVASQRGVAPYPARGVFASRSLPIAVEDGAMLSDQQTTLGIRFADFPAPPAANDRITLDPAAAKLANAVAGIYEVIAVHADGQGGADLPLRLIKPA